MFRPTIIAAIIIVASLIQTLEAADKTHSTFSYDIFSKGNDIGDMQVQIIEKTEGGYQILESTTIQKSSDWNEINLKC
jgi:hypothetical protein